MAHSTFTLKGKHTTPAGTAHKGSVKVTPNTVLRDSAGGVVLSGTETVILDATGAWSLTLPCDSAGLNPSTGIGYRIDYRLNASHVAPVSFYATAALAGTVVDAAQIVTTTIADTVTTTVVVSPIAFDTDGTPYLV